MKKEPRYGRLKERADESANEGEGRKVVGGPSFADGHWWLMVASARWWESEWEKENLEWEGGGSHGEESAGGEMREKKWVGDLDMERGIVVFSQCKFKSGGGLRKEGGWVKKTPTKNWLCKSAFNLGLSPTTPQFHCLYWIHLV